MQRLKRWPATPTRFHFDSSAPSAFNCLINSSSVRSSSVSSYFPVSLCCQNAVSARPSSNQNVVFGGSGNSAGTVNLGTTDFDPDSAFSGNVFTVPADGYYQFNAALSCGVSAGGPSDADLRGYISFNGGSSESLNDEPISTSLAGRVFTGSVYAYLAATTQVTLRYDFTLDAAGTVTIDASYTRLSGYRVR